MQTLAIEGLHESLRGDVQIAVLLHVQIDHLRSRGSVLASEGRLRRRAVEKLQPVAEDPDRVFECQRGDLRVDGRDLDREDLDLRKLQRLQIGFESGLRLLLAEKRLTQEVDVHAHAGLAARVQVPGEKLPLGGQDDVGGLLPHLVFDQGNGDAGEIAAKGLEALEQRAIDGAEEPGHPLHVEDVGQLIRRPHRALGPKRLVGELRQGRLLVRAPHHPLELGLLLPLLWGLQVGAARLEQTGQVNGLLGSDGGSGSRIRLEAV